MIKNDRVYATPLVQYRDTKANIEALTGIGEGAIAYATDTNEFGSYDGTTWTWGQSGSGGGITWSIITADQSAVVDNGYICNKGTLLTLTLPTTAAVNTRIRLAGMNAGLWKIAQNASQKIHFGNVTTTTGTGGYLASVHARDAVELICVVADLEWNVISSIGNITVV